MPIFEYQCEACDEKFEELVPSSDSKVSCPKCHSRETRKLLSVFAASGSGSSSSPSCARPGCGSGFS